ncbi:hypothetical protein BJY16_006036 [Actinoplanes octamycinicus]|uniref:Uncharacterized protein n=1 Tax=Actinoplanes octamycinicus TaxID=135948 RepID=A0A7W7MA42_9ACTN|nr:hypothetical protein [Actinoplanes octamycinicus]
MDVAARLVPETDPDLARCDPDGPLRGDPAAGPGQP